MDKSEFEKMIANVMSDDKEAILTTLINAYKKAEPPKKQAITVEESPVKKVKVISEKPELLPFKVESPQLVQNWQEIGIA